MGSLPKLIIGIFVEIFPNGAGCHRRAVSCRSNLDQNHKVWGGGGQGGWELLTKNTAD